MNEVTTQWTYNLSDVTQDKSRPRVSTPAGRAYEIIGADGNINGGLRPIQGFKQVAELDFFNTDSTLDDNYKFSGACRVIDFFPVNFRVQTETSEGFAYGYVYRIKESTKVSVFIEYYNSLTDRWISFGGNGITGVTGQAHFANPTDDTFRNTGKAATGSVTFTGAPTDGQTIVLTNTAGTATTLAAEDSIGAGTSSGTTFSTQGTNANRATALAACINGLTGGSDPDITAVADGDSVNLTQGTVGIEGNRSITNNLSNTSKVDFSGGQSKPSCLLTNRFTDETKQMSVSVWGRFVYVFCEGQSPVVFYSDESNYPSTIGATTADTFPGAGKQPQCVADFSIISNESIGGRAITGIPGLDIATVTGGMKFPSAARFAGVTVQDLSDYNYGANTTADGAGYHNTSNDSDGNAAPASTVDDDDHVFEKGDYAFAYYLYNSKTGRKTQLSQICECKSEDFASNDTLQICLDIRYDSDQYDQAYVYRSVRCEDAGGTYVAGILHLENIITLDDWHVVNGDTGDANNDTGVRTAVYWLQLSDAALVYQDVYLDKAIHDELMPFGGSSYFYDNSMLVSKIDTRKKGALGIGGSKGRKNRVGDAERGLGETRWSSIYEISPELFPPLNRYVPGNATSSVSRFLPVGPVVMGFARDRIHYIVKDGGFLKMDESYRGYGIVNDRAGDSIGPLAYFVTSRGLKAIHPNTQIDDVSALDKFIVEDWRDDHGVIQLAYDSTELCLYVHNPNKEQTAVLWFNTGKVTEIHDTNFDFCERGMWSSDLLDPNSSTSELEERVLWVMNNPAEAGDFAVDAPGSGFKPRIYVLDNSRTETQTKGGVAYNVIRTIQHSATVPNAKATSINTATEGGVTVYRVTVADAGSVTTDMIGSYAYVTQPSNSLTSVNASSIGKKFKIIAVNTSSKYLYMNAADHAAMNLGGSELLSISPVFFRYVGTPLTSAPPTPQRPVGGNNLFRVKQISSLGAIFSNVSIYPNESSGDRANFWRGVVYLGEDENAKAYGLPVNRSDNMTDSIENGESDHFAAFQNSDDSIVIGKHGVQGFSLSPGLEIFCVDVDYRLLQLQAKGVIRATSQSEINT